MRVDPAPLKRTSVLLTTVSLFFLQVALTGCQHTRTPNNNATHASRVIQNIGSDTMVNLAQAWAEEYAVIAPGVSIEVSGGGSGTGIAALMNNTADIANSSRLMEESELARYRAATGQQPELHVVGYDALAIFVHPNVPLEEITIEQLAAIYGETGTVRSWSDLGITVPGCQDNRIILISRQSNSGTYHYFREAILGRRGDFKLGTLDLHGSKDVVELVSRTPCAIGYSGMGYATSHVRMLRVARKAGERAVAPSAISTQTGDYPIARPLYMYTRTAPPPTVREFLHWIRSEAGQQIVSSTGYVPVHRATDRASLTH